MTDVLEVAQEVTTSTVERALNVPFDDSMTTRVCRFGFEYEIFPPRDYDDDYVDSSDVWSDDHSICNCEDCIGYRQQQEADRRHRDRDDDDPGRLISRAYDSGLVQNEGMCEYHCRCSACRHSRTDFLLTAQEDGSCGVEFISHVLDLRDFDDKAVEIAEWVNVMKRWRDQGEWMPDGHAANGNHVHVSKAGDDGFLFTPDQQAAAYRHIDALYAAFDWRYVADGGCGNIRGYNSKPGRNGGGSWLSDKGYATIEHRVWNTPADPDRLWVHLGLSIALTRWAFALVVNEPDLSFWTVTNDGWRGRYFISDEVHSNLTRNLTAVVEAVSQYIPDRPEFANAHTIIRNLRSM